ncbi:LysR family transcriptional regulator [Gordonia soli]|uniref:Putative LysR family transcriptional regulator n=1 Tax=Gordonia soli NBRC 108243 TaxID=1223545 RepID=M0QG05_9ACTN|nr:LysR family transcriptional regulator [Gordonia soli]GAC67241.1 putative LysR family transcriptional regulator [Gordonia soli NBRC 108243]
MDVAPSVEQVDVQQIRCLLVLAEELHFGRTAERLGLSQSRVSQLIGTLENRVGARLVERTSRRVALTPTGVQFVSEMAPAYAGLARAYGRARERAMRGALEELRVGFTGVVYEEITATFRALHERHGVAVHTHELPLGSPFAAVLAGDVDAIIVELPVYEPELTIGFRFPPQDQFVVVAADHPFVERSAVDLEDLADVDLVHRVGDAPDYWMASRTPPATPSGTPIRSSAGISSVHHGMALAASGRHAMLVCRPLVEHHSRADLGFVPVRGLEGTSQLGLVWRTDRTSPRLLTLARLFADAGAGEITAVRSAS